MRGVAGRAATHLVDTAPVAKGVVEGGGQGFRNESEGVEEVAFSCSVRSDQEGQWTEANLAGGDTLVVAKDDAADENGIRHRGPA